MLQYVSISASLFYRDFPQNCKISNIYFSCSFTVAFPLCCRSAPLTKISTKICKDIREPSQARLTRSFVNFPTQPRTTLMSNRHHCMEKRPVGSYHCNHSRLNPRNLYAKKRRNPLPNGRGPKIVLRK